MEIKRDVLLKEYTTFKIGGSADFFCHVTSKDELLKAYQFASGGNNSVLILGGGSNVLIPEIGFRGLVIVMAMNGISFNEKQDGEICLQVGAGENWDKVVELTVTHGFYGLENLSGIPGSVGASPIQNIGAYGVEVKNTLYSVEVFDTETQEFKIMNRDECILEYRSSIFKKKEGKKYIIIAVTFKLTRDGELSLEYPDIKNFFSIHEGLVPTLMTVRSAVLEIRKEKLPDLEIFGTAGSFFKNPVITKAKFEELKKMFPTLPGFDVKKNQYKIPAGYLIDKIGGFKGYRMGNVGVYEKQALVLINYGGGTSTEIISLVEIIEKVIQEKTKIILEREVCVL
jgi:UDP-N-acetylmuramate dehydrogenase